jgi:hypothetical protein
MKVSLDEYLMLRRELKNLRDIRKFRYPRGMLYTILHQKKVENVKRKYHVFAERVEEILDCWERERRFPRWLTLPPVMKVRLLLRGLGFSTKMINKALKEPEMLEEEELIKTVRKAVLTDFVYSPLAAKLQSARGRLGEKIIEIELQKNGVEYKTEKDLRGKYPKTPDFFFEKPLKLDGIELNWVESKALFGDPRTHKIYSKKQYEKYYELFGEGRVIYWFGNVDVIDETLDEGVFRNRLKNALFDMIVYLSESADESLAEKLNANYLELDGNDFEMAYRVIEKYSEGRVLAICERRMSVGRILRNMGFDVVYV